MARIRLQAGGIQSRLMHPTHWFSSWATSHTAGSLSHIIRVHSFWGKLTKEGLTKYKLWHHFEEYILSNSLYVSQNT